MNKNIVDNIGIVIGVAFWVVMFGVIIFGIKSCNDEIDKTYKQNQIWSAEAEKAERETSERRAKEFHAWYDGEHELFSLNTMVNPYSKSLSNGKLNGSGMFVLVAGGASMDGTMTQSSESGMIKEVTFSFKTVNGEYLVAKFPIDMVRFIPIDKKPFVRFVYTVPYNVLFDEMKWKDYVRTVKLYVPESAITGYNNLDLK